MQLFQVLQMLDKTIEPKMCKIHLAGWNGIENPLDVYLEGDFDAWQAWQTKRNFERPLVVSLIALSQVNRWLFAGVHDSLGCELVEDRGLFQYRLRRREASDELDGRLIVDFKRTGRQSYLVGENWTDALSVDEIMPEKLRVAEFPGYSWSMLPKRTLDIIIKQQIESWKSALGSVLGVYVIADRLSGKLYVGSATADNGGGIWSRWSAYAKNGHGGNKELVSLLRDNGEDYAENFQYGVLEIADSHASTKDVLRRESHWKELLLTRSHGYNAN